MIEQHERERAERAAHAARDDDQPAAAAIGERARREHQQPAGDVPDTEHEADLTRIRAEGLEEERLKRTDDPEAETPEHLDDDKEPDVAREAQTFPFTTPRVRRSSKSARARSMSMPSASASIATKAIAFAANKAAACASGVAAASRNAVE